MVLFSSKPSETNSYLYLDLLAQTNSIVVTFNHRIGLLGKSRVLANSLATPSGRTLTKAALLIRKLGPRRIPAGRTGRLGTL